MGVLFGKKQDGAEGPDEVLKRIRFTTDYDELSDVGFLVENVVEKWPVKEQVYGEIDEICPEDCIFAANTSCVSITKIGSVTGRPDKILGMHFMNPVPLKPVVEVIRGYHTSDETVDAGLELSRSPSTTKTWTWTTSAPSTPWTPWWSASRSRRECLRERRRPALGAVRRPASGPPRISQLRGGARRSPRRPVGSGGEDSPKNRRRPTGARLARRAPAGRRRRWGHGVHHLRSFDRGDRPRLLVGAVLVDRPDMVTIGVARWGSRYLKETMLPAMARAETLCALGLTEPEIGCDAARVKTRARKDGDDWVLTGRKKWITFGQIADLFLVLAQTEDDRAVAFLVPADAPGFSREPISGMVGTRASMLAELRLDDCRVPVEHLVGRVGFGFTAVINTVLDHGRYSVAWGAVGIAQACLDACLDYTAEREQFGKALREHQLVQRLLTDMITDTQAARLLCCRAGSLRATGDPGAGPGLGSGQHPVGRHPLGGGRREAPRRGPRGPGHPGPAGHPSLHRQQE